MAEFAINNGYQESTRMERSFPAGVRTQDAYTHYFEPSTEGENTRF